MRGWLAGSVALLMALSPVQALALSCLEYNIRDVYWAYKERPETYVLVLGEFSDLRRVSEGVAENRELWTAQFSGNRPSQRKFNQPFEAEVTLVFPDFSMIAGGEYDPSAVAEWLPGKTGLIWLAESAAGYQAEYGLCWPLLDTDPANVRRALNCLAGHRCPKPE